MPGQFANALQLVATDEQNRTLWATQTSASPWRAQLKRTMNYTIDSVAVQIASNEMGRSTTTVIPKEADLLTGLSVVVSLPGLAEGAHYKDRAGLKLIQKVDILLGTQCVQSFPGEYLETWYAFSQTAGKELKGMVGNFDSDQQRIANSAAAHRLYVPIPAFFQDKAFPIGRMVYEEMKVRLHLNPLASVVSGEGRVAQSVRAIGEDRKNHPPKASGGAPLRDTDAAVHLLCSYLYLEEGQTVETTEPLAITQVQTYTRHFDRSMPRQAIELDFHHPCRELLWRCDVDLSDVASSLLPDPVTNAMLTVNSHPRFSENCGEPVEGRYFRTFQPYMHHSRVPRDSDDGFYYCYSFDKKPESEQVGGALNFSRIDHSVLTFNMDTTYRQGTLHVFARTWNVLMVHDGRATLQFSS